MQSNFIKTGATVCDSLILDLIDVQEPSQHLVDYAQFDQDISGPEFAISKCVNHPWVQETRASNKPCANGLLVVLN